jgi:bacterioferritin-associated ferredoxin
MYSPRIRSRSPFGSSEGLLPNYACYCSKVTEEEVMQAVAKLGTTSLKEIIEATGAMQNSHCIEQNPLGVCCHKILEEAKGM